MDTKKNLLFVCTGNYYRSRHAEVFFNYLAGIQNLDYFATSRGFKPDPSNSGPLSRYVIERLEETNLNLTLDLRLPIKLKVSDLESADRVIAMDGEEHFPKVAELFPEFLDRFEFWAVPDVPGLKSRVALPLIEERVSLLTEEIGLRSHNQEVSALQI